MDTLTGGLSDSLYDLVPGGHHAAVAHAAAHSAHADTTHAHAHGHARDGDGPGSLLTGGGTHIHHNQHGSSSSSSSSSSASSTSRLTVLSAATRTHEAPREERWARIIFYECNPVADIKNCSHRAQAPKKTFIKMSSLRTRHK
ncbi:hypothetical protein SK128_022724 [Halocaridina rubra]|uniref:Uncharacterized protein n=1 Tax=Halocaridina rubra TaxID=373956 RepID=A0AAN8X433_HALRR